MYGVFDFRFSIHHNSSRVEIRKRLLLGMFMPLLLLRNYAFHLRFGAFLVVLQGGEKARFGCKSGNVQILLRGSLR